MVMVIQIHLLKCKCISLSIEILDALLSRIFFLKTVITLQFHRFLVFLPFSIRFIRPDSHRKKCKTGVKWRTLNPIFQEEFSFETRPSEMDKQTLYISVWDRDLAKSDDFLGSLIIGHTSKGSRLKQWRGKCTVQ